MNVDERKSGSRVGWTLAIVSIANFMLMLDTLVVVTAIPVIRTDLGASLADLEWTVNAYTLAFAVLLLTGASLGDRFGRRRMYSIGMAIFTLGSIGAALATSVEVLVASRAVQGAGGAIVAPLTLTILSAAVPKQKRAFMIGVLGAVGGLAVALGPLVGGAVVEGMSWQWIFWLNVPVGVILLPLAWSRLSESFGPDDRLDPPGLVLVSAGLFGLVHGLVRGNPAGWASAEVVVSFAAGAILLGLFVWWEARAPAPMLPLRFFRSRTFAMTNIATLFMFFGLFGAVFLIVQFFQTVQGYGPLKSGLLLLPWTGMPILVAPLAGLLSDRVGAARILSVGLALLALGLGWFALVASPTASYGDLIAPFVLAGVGMSAFLAPVGNVVLSAVRAEEEGQASGANSAIREVGGVFGIAVLAAVFARSGGYGSGQEFVDGLIAALWVGAVTVALGAIAAHAVPGVLRHWNPFASHRGRFHRLRRPHH